MQEITPRQLQIIQLVFEEKSTKEIAGIVGVSTERVRQNKRQLMRKINVRSDIGLVKWALKNRLVNVK